MRFTFERSTDWPLIRGIITHPKVYRHAADDFAPTPEDFQPIQDERLLYLLVRDEASDVMGLFMLIPQSFICWEVHTCLLPWAWGAKAQEISRQGVAWVFENTQCLRIVTAVPEYNMHAARLSEAAGMTVYGENEDSYMKDGKLMNQFLFGISKPRPEGI